MKTFLSNIFMFCILKYIEQLNHIKFLINTVVLPNFFHIVLNKNVYYILMPGVRFLIWCCLIHVHCAIIPSRFCFLQFVWRWSIFGANMPCLDGLSALLAVYNW